MKAADLNIRINLIKMQSAAGIQNAGLLTQASITVWANIKPLKANRYAQNINHYAPAYQVTIRRLAVNAKSFDFNFCEIDDESYEIQDVMFVENDMIQFIAVKET
ncbi:MAG: hypothetical protein QXT25_03360 [Candidatus Anstonellaceae archaeon]